MFDKFERVVVEEQRKKLQCNECKRQTIHMLEARCTGTWSYEDFGHTVDGGSHFSLFRCGACDSVCFEQDSWDSEGLEHDYNGQSRLIHDYAQYPPPSSADFSFDTAHVPQALSELIDEMMYALAGGKFNLATIGLRLVVEFIVNDTKCSGGNLAKKIDDLREKEHIDDAQKDLLHTIRLKGNKGAHQGVSMKKNEMVVSMSIVALLLEKLYNGPARHADAISKAQKAFKEDALFGDG